MIVFIDSSGLYSVLDRDEENHSTASRVWNDLLQSDAVLVTTNYVLLETAALAQRRIGLDAVRVLHDEIVPALEIEWIAEEAHLRGVEAALIAGRRGLSVVDCVSFRSMRRRNAVKVFTFDKHFREHGFAVIPAP